MCMYKYKKAEHVIQMEEFFIIQIIFGLLPSYWSVAVSLMRKSQDDLRIRVVYNQKGLGGYITSSCFSSVYLVWYITENPI